MAGGPAEARWPIVDRCLELLGLSPRIEDEFSVDDLQGLSLLKEPQEDLVIYDQKRRKVANITALVNQRTLRFDIEIYRRFRSKGLYRFLLGKVLEFHPEVRSIPSIMSAQDSLNAQIFFKELFRASDLTKIQRQMDVEFPRFFSAAEMERTEIRAWRERIVSAFFSTPAAKARTAHGFSCLEKITLSLQGQCLSFDVTKGPFKRLDEIRIFIRMGEEGGVELLPSGHTTTVTSTEARIDPDYIETWKPCEE